MLSARLGRRQALLDHRMGLNTLVNETRMNFRPYVDQRRVLRFFYYAWLDSREGFAVFRCGHLIETGHLAMSPF